MLFSFAGISISALRRNRYWWFFNPQRCRRCNTTQDEAKAGRRRVFCNSEERQVSRRDASAQLSSQHVRTQTAAAFSIRGEAVVCFPFFFFFFFFSTNSKYRNPPRGKMIRSDSTLNQLFPLCGHCFLFFAVKQAKQPVKRPEPSEGTAIVC